MSEMSFEKNFENNPEVHAASTKNECKSTKPDSLKTFIVDQASQGMQKPISSVGGYNHGLKDLI